MAIQQQLVREQPGSRSFRADLGWTIIYSKLWSSNHDTTKVYQPQAVAIFEGLARENPDDPFARLGLVWALGLNLGKFSNPDEWAMSERRLALLEQLVKEYPLSAEFRRDLANQLGYPRIGESNSDYTAQLARVSRANELQVALIAGLEQHDPAILLPLFPKDSEARMLRPSLMWAKYDLANGWQRQSKLLARLKRWPEAVSFADRATAMQRDVLEQNPAVKPFAVNLNNCFDNQVQMAKESGDKAGAQARRLEADNFWRTHPSIGR